MASISKSSRRLILSQPETVQGSSTSGCLCLKWPKGNVSQVTCILCSLNFAFVPVQKTVVSCTLLEALAALRSRVAVLVVVISVSLVIIALALVGFGHAFARASEANCDIVSRQFSSDCSNRTYRGYRHQCSYGTWTLSWASSCQLWPGSLSSCFASS